ncbi:TRAP transporter small permease [Thauera phenolivorans]|uniref:TRAP transporter small permease n=1 Tax=Thauera phenolivorans TaxID=1792543 RepID=UPI001301255C|nr:TRAP transporter small permease [Thauera phenolivorans]
MVSVLDRIVGWVCTFAMGLAALGLLTSLGLISYSVAMRYLFNSPVVWVDDVIGFVLVAIVMLAAGDALRKGEHIGVDFLTARLQGRIRKIAAVWSMIAVLVTAGFLVVDGWNTASFAKTLGLMSHGQVEIPMYLLQMLMPIGGALLFLAAILALLRTLCGMPTYAPLHPPQDGSGR